jgi:hypothetical protein
VAETCVPLTTSLRVTPLIAGDDTSNSIEGPDAEGDAGVSAGLRYSIKYTIPAIKMRNASRTSVVFVLMVFQ